MTLTRPILADQTSDAPPPELIGDLTRRGICVAGTSATILRGGRTNRLWRLSSANGAVVLKLFAAPDGNPLFDNDPDREAAALGALVADNLSPALHATGQHQTGTWLVYDHVPGGTWIESPEPVACALFKVHRTDPDRLAGAELPVRPGGSAAIALQGQRALAPVSGPERDRLEDLAAGLAEVAPAVDLRTVHGDPVPGNVIPRGDGVVFIDWQCPALGDPAEDLALFLSPAMQRLYRGKPLENGEEREFLTAYPDRKVADRYDELKPWFHWRMAAYCLWQMARGNHDYAEGLVLERDALAKAIGG